MVFCYGTESEGRPLMSNMPGDCGSTHPDGKDTHHHMHPHVGMRKVKSILAIFCGFCLWQLIRLFVPGLEVHPIFIYIYGMMEIRETSEKTKENGKMRILATLTAVGVGLPIMFLTDWLLGQLPAQAYRHWVEAAILLAGSLLVLCAAELLGCHAFCGLATAIYIVLIVSHFESSMYLYSFMRAIQTILAVLIAWFINVKLLPYPPVPGSVSGWIMRRKDASESEPQ